MNLTDLELLLLNHIKSPGYRPVKPRVIAKQLGLPEVAASRKCAKPSSGWSNAAW